MFNKFIHITILLIALFAFSIKSFSQEKKPKKKQTKPTVVKIDTTANTKSLLKNQISKSNSKLKGFIDKNANGIDDRLEAKKGKGKGMHLGRRDVFIDKNGDGICDGRESAIGLKKTMRHRMGKK